jgi:uncharacterized protein YcaQ
MPRISAPRTISLADARRIWLHAQRLDDPAPFGDGAAATRAAVEHLGYVQIDTIHVIERSHHHVLWTRIPAYRRADLATALSVEKSVFEYWTHALAYVPTRDLRFFLPAMRERARSDSAPELRRIVARVRREGALSIRDIDDDELVEKDHPWASRKPSKRALERAFDCGALTVSARSGMLKTYDLTDRHFGWPPRPRAATDKEVLGYLLDRGLRAQGIVSLDSLGPHRAGRRAAVAHLIETRVRRRRLVPVALGGGAKADHWMLPETAEAPPGPAPDLVHILSPFDPLVIRRRRLARFFGYEHVFEAYVPKARRILGYFALPVLVGDRIVAAIDLKADRESRRLLIQRWTWTADADPPRHKASIEEALHRFERFQFDA